MKVLFVVVATRPVPLNIQQDDSAAAVAPRQLKQGLESQEVQVDYFPVPGTFSRLNYLKACLKIFALSLRGQLDQYDLIHAHYGYNGVVARCQFRRPVVVTFMGSDVYRKWEGRLARILARLVAAVIVPQEKMVSRLGYRAAQVIPYGLDLETFVPADQPAARQALGLPPDKKLVIFPYDPTRGVKRYDIIAQAVAQVENAEIVTIYGQPSAVIAQHMNACDAFVMASDYEGSPVAIREALACNLPIVSVDVGDVRDFIADVPGCYICQRDPDDIAARLRLIFAQGERLSNGREKVADLGLAAVAERVRAVYLRVLGGKNAATVQPTPETRKS